MGPKIALALLTLLAVAGVVVPTAPQATSGGPVDSGDTSWLIAASGLVLLMTPGLAFFYAGMVRMKNIISTLVQSFVAMGVVSLVWVTVGFSMAFGESLAGVIGNPATFFFFRGVGGNTHPELARSIPLMLFALFQMKFAIITPALVTGAFAERIKFGAYLLWMVLFSLFIYAPLAHWAWHPEGFLHQWGVLDFAGGTTVHISAGCAAVAGAIAIGRRRIPAGEPHSPANIPFILLGAGMLWFGWFGFNAGSALGANDQAVLAFATTNTASASAMLGWILFDWSRGGKPTAMGAAIGAVVGLVAITPSAGFVTVGQSVAIGLITSIVSNLAVGLRHKFPFDDTLDVAACHGLGGVIGMILAAVFAKDVGLVAGETRTFVYHLIALPIVVGFSFLGSFGLFKLVDAIVGLRVSERDEDVGLDHSQHGETVNEQVVAATLMPSLRPPAGE